MLVSIVQVFLFAFCIDIAYVFWLESVRKQRYLRAGLASVLISAPALFGFYLTFQNLWLCIPYFIGLFWGTVFGMKLTKWLEERHEAEDSND